MRNRKPTPDWKARQSNLIGQAGEAAAQKLLVAKGFEILERRWLSELGEIDLIARKDRLIAFVEVKSSRTINSAVQLLGPSQVARISRAAQLWIVQNAQDPKLLFRFDAILVGGNDEVKHIENAWTL